MKGGFMKALGMILILAGILLAIAFVPLIFLGSNYPTASLVAPMLCGADSEILSETTVVENEITENISRVRFLGNMQCVNSETGETSDLTTMLLIVATVPAVLLFVIGLSIFNMGAAFGGMGGLKEAQEMAKDPQVKAKLDSLTADLKAGRISYEEYLSQYNQLIADYKARQAAS
jgi:hypothetical protein